MTVRRLFFLSLLTAPGWCCCVIPLPRRTEAHTIEVPHVTPHVGLTIPGSR